MLTPVAVDANGVPNVPVNPHFIIQAFTDQKVVDCSVFTAPRACRLIKAQCNFGVTNGGALTAAIKKCTGTQAPSAGTALSSGTFDLNATANTVQSLGLTSTQADLTLAAGDRIGIDFTGSRTNLDGATFTFWFAPL